MKRPAPLIALLAALLLWLTRYQYEPGRIRINRWTGTTEAFTRQGWENRAGGFWDALLLGDPWPLLSSLAALLLCGFMLFVIIGTAAQYFADLRDAARRRRAREKAETDWQEYLTRRD